MYLGLTSILLFVFNLTSRVSTLPPVIVDELSYQDSMDLQVFIFIIELLLTNSDLHDLNNSQGFLFLLTMFVSVDRDCSDYNWQGGPVDGWPIFPTGGKTAGWELDPYERWWAEKILHMLISCHQYRQSQKNKFNMNLSLRKFCLVFKINFMKLVLSLVSIHLISTCQTNCNISEVIGIYWY